MAQSYWPFDGIDTTETQYSQMFRRLQTTGVWGDPGDTTLKLVQGSGLNATLKAGYAFIRGHMYYNDSDLPIPFAAGGASPRTDRLVLKLDPSANTITPVVLQNTAPTQTDAGVYEMLIATVARAASSAAVVTADITDSRTFADMAYGTWTTANRPASPRRGQPGWNETLLKPEYWDGDSWELFSPGAITAAMISDPQNITAGNATKVGGRTIYVQTATPASPVNGDLWFTWTP